MTRPNAVEWNAVIRDSHHAHPYRRVLYRGQGALPGGLMALHVACSVRLRVGAGRIAAPWVPMHF